MTQSVFHQRLQQFGPELRDLYEQLYHSKRDFVDFVAMLEQSFEQRSDALKTWMSAGSRIRSGSKARICWECWSTLSASAAI